MTHELPNLDRLRELLQNHEDRLGYVGLAREAPRTGAIERFEWSVEKARERGLLVGDDDDLVEACVLWAEGVMLADAQPGEAQSYRARLAEPGGNYLVQPSFRLTPTSTIEDLADTSPSAVDDITLEVVNGLLRTMQGLIVEQRSMYRAVGAERMAIFHELRGMLREAAEDRRMLLDAHVNRELGIIRAGHEQVEAERRRAELELKRAAAEKGDGDFVGRSASALADTAMKLWAVHQDLPPDLLTALATDDGLRELASNPRLVERLKDPEIQELLRTVISQEQG